MRLLLLLLLSLKPALGFAADNPQPGATRLFIAFQPNASALERQRAIAGLGLKSVGDIAELNATVAELPPGRMSVQAVEEKSIAFPAIAGLEEDFFANWIKEADAPSFQKKPLPSWSEVLDAIPGLKPKSEEEIPWGVQKVNAPALWPKAQGRGVRVAVIDTGIDPSHPDLVGNVVGGHNAILFGGDSWIDDNGHGTHVSGTIAALKNGKGVIGVAPQAKLYGVKVLNAQGMGWMSSIALGLIWCANHDIQVANMSLGAPRGSLMMHLALKYAVSKGVTVVVAAGNSCGEPGADCSVEYPAAYSEAIAVAASDVHNHIADFSSRGPRVDFIAPGVAIKSTIPGGKYAVWDGTSMATPHVTGLAALAIQLGADSPAKVRAALRHAARSIGLAPSEQGKGLIDAALLAR